LIAGGVLGAIAFAAFQASRPVMDMGATAAEPIAKWAESPEEAATAAPAASTNGGSGAVPAEPRAETYAPLQVPARSHIAHSAGDTTADLLEQRLLAAERWLQETQRSRYTVQLLGASDPKLLRNHLNTIANYIELNEVFVYRTFARERPIMAVVYGNFASRREALEEIERLPEELKSNRPYYRTIGGIRAEIGMDDS
jgi:septal ring-binding cell division protein DamX